MLNSSENPNPAKAAEHVHQQLLEVRLYLNQAKTDMLANNNERVSNIPKHFKVINSRINWLLNNGYTEDQFIEAHFNHWGSSNLTVAEDQADYQALKAAITDLNNTVKTNRDKFIIEYDANDTRLFTQPLNNAQKNALSIKIDAVLALLEG